MRRLKTLLREQRRDDEQPTPVVIEYDSLAMTQAEAIEAAIQSGHVPKNAVLAVFPRRLSREAWDAKVRAEYEAREAASQTGPTHHP
jgi:hypothetical protein